MHDSERARPLDNPFPDHGRTPPAQQLELADAGNNPLPLGRARDAWDDLVDAGVSPRAQLIYLRLALRANREGLARCSGADLAADLGLERCNVLTDLRLLARRGFVTPVTRVAGALVAGGPAHARIGYQLAAMVAPIRAV